MEAAHTNPNNESSILELIPDFRCNKTISVISFVAIIGFIAVLFMNWSSLTPCAQRQAVAVVIAFMFWQFRGDSLASFFGEILQVTAVFIIIQKLNMADMEAGKSCLEIYTPYSKFIYILYVFFFSYYMGLSMILGFLMTGYMIHECMGGSVNQRNRRSLRSVRGRDFEALEKVKFSVSTMNSLSNQTMCSICLSEFEELEEIIKLPVCNHCFHNNCLKTWLETHYECPYCRSNIKTNLRSIRDQNLNSSMQSLEDSLHESSQEDQSIALDMPALAAGGGENEQVYVEMIGLGMRNL